MNWRRKMHLMCTALPRALHRHGFGIQSPWAYELIRDVLYEQLHYYAYEERNLRTPLQRQLFRIENHFRLHPMVVIDQTGQEAVDMYEQTAEHATSDTVAVVEHADGRNARLWQLAVDDPRAIITFDMGKRGLIVFDTARVKQNYLL